MNEKISNNTAGAFVSINTNKKNGTFYSCGDTTSISLQTVHLVGRCWRNNKHITQLRLHKCLSFKQENKQYEQEFMCVRPTQQQHWLLKVKRQISTAKEVQYLMKIHVCTITLLGELDRAIFTCESPHSLF